MRAPGQACLEKGTATTSHSRQMGSAAEGTPELEMGTSRTPAVLHLSCTSWCQVGHVQSVSGPWIRSGFPRALRSLHWKWAS